MINIIFSFSIRDEIYERSERKSFEKKFDLSDAESEEDWQTGVNGT